MDLESLIEKLMKKEESELDINVLKREVNEYGSMVAHEMANRGYEFKNKEFLKIASDGGWTVAHVMADRGYKFKDKEILKLATEYGWTVAHEMAKREHTFKDKEILELAYDSDWTVVHEIALNSLDLMERVNLTTKSLFESERQDLKLYGLLKFFNFTASKMKINLKSLKR